MANKSEKKSEQARQQTIKYFQTAILIVAVFYLLNYLLRGLLFQMNTLLEFGFFTLINYGCYSSIEKRIGLGLESGSYDSQLDLLVLNSVTQFGTCFWSGFWYLYVLVPVYIIWKWVLPWAKLFFMARSMGGNDEDIDDSQLSNTQRKKREREKEGKEKVVYKKVK